MINSTDAYMTAITGAVRQMYIKAIVDLISPDIVYGTATAQSESAYSKPTQIHDKKFDNPKKYATLETDRWKLDGTWDIYPTDAADVTADMGYMSNALCGSDGTFTTAQYIEMVFSGVPVLQACSVYFPDNKYDGVPADFTVEVNEGGTAYYTKTYTGNTAAHVNIDGFTVNNPDAICVTVTKMSKGNRRLRIIEIVPGIYEQWDSDIIAELSISQQVDFSCLSLPYGSAALKMDNLSRRFEPRSKSGLFRSIEERQAIPLSIGVKLADGTVEYKQCGVYYQYSSGWKTGDNGLTMQWDLVDIIGLLKDRAYIAPTTLPTTLSGWAASLVSQLGTNFADKYSVDSNYANTTLTTTAAAISGKTCGDMLRYICMAGGTWPRADAETGKLCIEPLWSAGNYITLDNMTKYPTLKANNEYAALIFKVGSGTYTISGNSTTASQTVSVDNPFITTQAGAIAAARNILTMYGGNQIEVTSRGDPSSECGDVDSVQLDKSQATSARRYKQEYNFSGGVMSALPATLLQANGYKLYSKREIITSNGTWTAPSGVTAMRIIVVGGGNGGIDGTDGSYSSAGVAGANGLGSKVYSAEITINDGQSFVVVIGTGGAANGGIGTNTTFGSYTSASGQNYNGYTDINDGSTFARDGVYAPLANSGDGGRGGDGGNKGKYHTEQVPLSVAEIIAQKPMVGTGISAGAVTGAYITAQIASGAAKSVDVIDSAPTAGGSGVAGGSGCVVVYYDT